VKIDEKTNFIVTGGASGLGEAVVRRVIELGGRATVLDMSDEHGKKIEEDFKGKVVFVKTNVTKEADVQKAIEIAVQKIWNNFRRYQLCGGWPSYKGYIRSWSSSSA